ncbi:LysR family transcriptional regulator [Paracoccus alkanivorans]|uniref:LysR family transcriptional regulator n=1 Tax=Paracoccus alkanivorans TaxID=2116655 RepID=A0A3M0M1E0_9RHOB|nr:LysR family transcriptional regulator [Paracoccus alkanivorans]RMC31609.1 LysR family transcriptional regulator [Paracoccus alkanivorans]
MPRTDFNDLMWFRIVAEERNFTRAAARIGVAQSTLSHTIKRLETNMGLRLLNRTTRNVSPTPAGERLLATVAPRLGEIEDEIAALMVFRDKPSGSLRLTLSDHAFQTVVWPKLKPVLQEHPDIRIEFSLDSGFRNIVEDGFDAGVRLGESVEKDMIAARIGPDWRMIAVASPAYLASRDMPGHPRDLVDHDCINMRHETRGGLYAWEFEKDGQEVNVRVDGQLTFNNSYAMMDAVLSGLGVAFLPNTIADPYVASGDLILLLDDWSPFFDGYFLYYPTRRQNLPVFKLVLDALRHRSARS